MLSFFKTAAAEVLPLCQFPAAQIVLAPTFLVDEFFGTLFVLRCWKKVKLRLSVCVQTLERTD